MPELPQFSNPFGGAADRRSSGEIKSWLSSKRSSIVSMGDTSRKPSVAPFHGDMLEEKARQKRRAFWWKVLCYASIFLIGLLVGGLVGYFSFKNHEVSTPVSTSSSETVIAATTSSVADLTSEKAVKQAGGRQGGSGGNGGNGGNGAMGANGANGQVTQTSTTTSSTAKTSSTSTTAKASTTSAKTSTTKTSSSTSTATSIATSTASSGSSSSSSHVILPLYLYPTSGAWDYVYSNISANPDVEFYVVVNPSSGPGSSQYPDSDYITAIAKLNSYSNVKLLGYVDTGEALIAASTVNSDVSTYKGWASYTAADIHVDGIFFDDVDGTYSTATYNYYQGIYTQTKSTMGTGYQHVLFNAGATVDSRYFAIADEIIVFEGFYSDYTDDTILSTPEEYWNQAAILIHHFTGDTARQQAIIDNLVGNNVQGVYISTTGDWSSSGVAENSDIYENLSSMWTRFCSDMY